MKKWTLPFIFLLLMGCQLNENRDLGTEEQGLEHTRSDGVQTNDEILLESRREVKFVNEDLQVREAERMLMDYLQIDKNQQIVQYDHKENGKYILQVYNPNGFDQQHVQWYSIDIKTKEIEKLTK